MQFLAQAQLHLHVHHLEMRCWRRGSLVPCRVGLLRPTNVPPGGNAHARLEQILPATLLDIVTCLVPALMYACLNSLFPSHRLKPLAPISVKKPFLFILSHRFRWWKQVGAFLPPEVVEDILGCCKPFVKSCHRGSAQVSSHG